MQGTVDIKREGPVLLLTLSRPDKLNALSPAIVEGLQRGLSEARASDVKVLLIAGEGRSFCSGGDLDQLASDSEDGRQYIASVTDLLASLRAFPKPVVAAIQGHAVGAGAEIACEADVILMATDAVLRLSDVTIGSTPATVFRILRLIGLGPASRMALLGEDLKADRALELGLAYSVVTPQELHDSAMAVARRLADFSLLSLRLVKQSLRLAQGTDGFNDLWVNLEAELTCHGSPEMRRELARLRKDR